jgi:redox-sensitive bicupin YhaK (pirin superfamily)
LLLSNPLAVSSANFMNTHFQIKPLGFHWETYDPFLFCAHHHDIFPKGEANLGPAPSLLFGRDIGQDFSGMNGWSMYHGNKVPGFPAHPHRGFETVTIAEKGLIDHSDSIGAMGRFGNGDVQWMTAGAGVQHSEMFPLLNQSSENELLLFQIWLNLPAKSKKASPYFSMQWHEDIPVIEMVSSKGRKASIKIIAGSCLGKKSLPPPPDSWAANEANEIAIWILQLEPEAEFTIEPCAKGTNRALYNYEGNGFKINELEVKPKHQVRMEAAESIHIQNGNSISRFLYLQGKPIGEPVVQYGPFVMNSREEIQQAFVEFNETQFGSWPWGQLDHVHPAEKGRFAVHANGLEELRG